MASLRHGKYNQATYLTQTVKISPAAASHLVHSWGQVTQEKFVIATEKTVQRVCSYSKVTRGFSRDFLLYQDRF